LTIKPFTKTHFLPFVQNNKNTKLNDNKDLSNWVEKGKEIHKDKNICEFCGNDLPSDLLQKLKTILDKLNSSKIILDFSSCPETAFYSDIWIDFQSSKLLLETELQKSTA
jgi:hypothetical protein